MIYLDNNATTAPDRNMLNAMVEEVARNYGNPSSSHEAGYLADGLLDDARFSVANALGWDDSVVFTSGGTEANNLALTVGKGRPLICSSVEHSSVFNCSTDAERVPVNKYGLLDIDALEQRLKVAPLGGPVFLSVMYANNETGVILDPADQISRLKSKYDFIYHVDAVQGFGKIIDFKLPSGADMVSISAHKFHGLKGAGALLTKLDLHQGIKRMMCGGSHEFGVRPGTENQSGIFSLGYMADKISNNKFYREKLADVYRKRDRFETLLSDVSEVNGSKKYRVGNTSSLYFPDVSDPDLFLTMLSSYGVMASGRSACSSGMPIPSRVIQAMYGDRCRQQAGTVRFSLSVYTTDNEIEEAISKIKETLDMYRRLRSSK